MLDPFNDDRADALIKQLAAQQTLAPAKKVLERAAARAKKSWLDELALCKSALAAAATVAIARGWPDNSPVPDRLTNWLAATAPPADDKLAALAAEVVEKLRTNSILQDIAEDVRLRSFKPDCADLVKRLKKPARSGGPPKAAAAKKRAAAMSAAAARKHLEKQRCRFSTYERLLTFNAYDETIVTDANLAVLGCVADLGRANLGASKSPFTAAGLAHLAGLAKLKALGLRHVANDDMLAAISGMTSLRELSLYHAANVTDDSLRHLSSFKQLEALDIGRTQCDGSGLAHVPVKLKSLDLTGLALSDQGAKAIGRFTALEELRLSFARLPKGLFRGLAGLKRLARLDAVSAQGIDDRALVDLAQLGSLQELNLYSVQGFSGAGLASLGRLKKLVRLDLRSTAAADKGFDQIAALPKLRELDLEHSQASDAGLAALVRSKSIRTLNLKKTKVTVAGVAHLAGMKSMRELDLSFTKLADAAAEHLVKMKWLDELNLLCAGLSPQTQRSIGKALKGVDVTLDP
jgi:hypothetical protein